MFFVIPRAFGQQPAAILANSASSMTGVTDAGDLPPVFDVGQKFEVRAHGQPEGFVHIRHAECGQAVFNLCEFHFVQDFRVQAVQFFFVEFRQVAREFGEIETVDGVLNAVQRLDGVGGADARHQADKRQRFDADFVA